MSIVALTMEKYCRWKRDFAEFGASYGSYETLPPRLNEMGFVREKQASPASSFHNLSHESEFEFEFEP